MSVPSPSARRLSVPRWLDVRLVAGVVLVLVAVVAGASIVSHSDRTYPMVTATRDLTPGTVLSTQDLSVVQVRLPGDAAGVYLDSVQQAVGRQVSRPVAAGELLPAASLRRAAAQTTLTIPFAAGAAPDLRAGQRLEIWLSTATCSSTVLLDGVAVQDVNDNGSATFSGDGAGQDVVVAVAPDLAERVVAALSVDQAQIRAGVLSGGTQPATPTPAAELPSLTDCLATDRVQR